jgi:hypothetical protein
MEMWMSFKTIAVAQWVLGAAAFTLWWFFKDSRYLARPVGPAEEYYAHHWGFQLGVLGLYLVALLAVISVVIVLEYTLLRLVRRIRSRGRRSG